MRATILAMGMLAILGVRAADGSTAAVIDADPPGSYLAIHGPVSVAGSTPLPVDVLPEGEYELTADGPGLPAVRGRLRRTADGMVSRPWSNRGALLLPPGMLHLDRGETRGWSILCAGAVSATLAILSEADRRDAKNDRAQAEAAYRWAITEEAITAARAELLSATQEEDDRAEVRNLWLGYLAATWLGAGLEMQLLTPQPSLAEGDSGRYLVTLPRAGAGTAALRSALMPGAGQRYMGRMGRSNFFFTATAALAAAAIISHDAVLEARRDQARAQRLFDEADGETEVRHARDALQAAADDVDDHNLVRWALIGATAGVYLWNIADAFGLGRGAEPRSLPLDAPADEDGLSWSVAPRGDGLLVCATWRLP